MNPTSIFLRGAWNCIPSEDDLSWVHRVKTIPSTSEPIGDYGPIIKEMLDKGISPYTIARFAKIIGYETAFDLLYHLDNPSTSYEGLAMNEEEIEWGLYLVNPDTEEPIEEFSGLHESILSMDPSGREMRPK